MVAQGVVVKGYQGLVMRPREFVQFVDSAQI